MGKTEPNKTESKNPTKQNRSHKKFKKKEKNPTKQNRSLKKYKKKENTSIAELEKVTTIRSRIGSQGDKNVFLSHGKCFEC